MKKILLFFSAFLLLYSCKKTLIDDSQIISSSILSREEQKKLSPEIVLNRLKKGNEIAINESFTVRQNTSRVRNATIGQYPEAVILSCLDSRIPVEDIFHKSIGDLYVLRIAGNIVDDDVLGGMEYSCKIAGAKIIVVLGHDYCASIKSCITGVNLDHFAGITNEITPSISQAKANFKGHPSENNPLFLDAVCKNNVYHSIKKIRNHSSILNAMEHQKEIKIVGAIYDIQTGKVRFLPYLI